MHQWSHDGVRKERTGWRCEAISQRHRDWGYNCPTVDLDFLVLEYNYCKSVAIVEYKDRHASEPDPEGANYRSLVDLADNRIGGALPCLIAIYDPVQWWFRVIPLNDAAREHYKHIAAGELITEQRFVKSLYLLRKKVLSKQDEIAIAKLSDALPSVAA